MIQANELRLGNWVIIDNEPKQVRAFSEEDVFYSGVKVFGSWNRPRIEIPSVCECKIEKIQPIVLTEYILFKCGFVIKDGCYYFSNTKIILDGKLTLLDIDIFVRIKYLHQLQNLIYSLTNQELVYNE